MPFLFFWSCGIQLSTGSKTELNKILFLKFQIPALTRFAFKQFLSFSFIHWATSLVKMPIDINCWNLVIRRFMIMNCHSQFFKKSSIFLWNVLCPLSRHSDMDLCIHLNNVDNKTINHNNVSRWNVILAHRFREILFDFEAKVNTFH